MFDSLLVASLRACLGDLFLRYPVALAYLYGSAAIGRATSLSDVDIAILIRQEDFEPGSKLYLELQLEDEIAQACKIGQVDVRVINLAPIMVRGAVITDGILLYSLDEAFRVEFETSTRSQYFDFLPVAELHNRAYFEHLYQRGLDD
jgi:predicted nucleotidyltransferase